MNIVDATGPFKRNRTLPALRSSGERKPCTACSSPFALRRQSATCWSTQWTTARQLRWVADEQLHLTLRFIGEVERPVAERSGRALGPLRSDRFELRISGVGRFDQKRGGAVWAGVEPKAPVAALAAKVERACQSIGI